MAITEPAHDQPPPGSRPPRVADLVVTISLLIIVAGTTLVGSVLAMAFFFLGDNCSVPGGTICNSAALTLGISISVAGPWIPVLVVGVIAIFRMVRRRSFLWFGPSGFRCCRDLVRRRRRVLSSNPSFTL